jgi:hypothetical protein
VKVGSEKIMDPVSPPCGVNSCHESEVIKKIVMPMGRKAGTGAEKGGAFDFQHSPFE